MLVLLRRRHRSAASSPRAGGAAESLHSLDEWGLGGRGFGTVVTWFLLGGDLYTAYTFVAVPAAMFATGAVSGFFAVPYTIVAYPIIFVFMPRLWSVAHRNGYVTPADFVRGRYDSRGLALAVAITGILATMPYIALQLVGIQAVLDTMGLGGSGNAFVRDLPLIIAFAVLAAYTYSSGLRAPALIAFVKDTLIYIVIVVAIIYVGAKIGFGDMFDAAKTKMATPTPTGAPTGAFITSDTTYWAYGTLAFGSALALFMYPHSMTAVLSSRSRAVIRRNAAILPAYSLMLALLALLGFAAIANEDDRVRPGRHGQRRSWPCRTSSSSCSRPGSPASASPRSRSVRWCRRRSCRSRRPTCSPATSTASSSSRDATPKHEAQVVEDRLAGGEVRRAAVRARPRPAERDQPAAARRRVDPADDRVDRRRALHALVPPVGAARRLGGRHGLRHGRGLPAEGAEHEDQAGRRQAGHDGRRHAALRRVDRQLPVHRQKVYIAVTALCST